MARARRRFPIDQISLEVFNRIYAQLLGRYSSLQKPPSDGTPPMNDAQVQVATFAPAQIAQIITDWALEIAANNPPTSRAGDGRDGGHATRSITKEELDDLNARFAEAFPT
jgi:Cu/Ag efflux pump CusA